MNKTTLSQHARAINQPAARVPEPNLSDVGADGMLHNCARGIATEFSYNEAMQDASWDACVQFVLDKMRYALRESTQDEIDAFLGGK